MPMYVPVHWMSSHMVNANVPIHRMFSQSTGVLAHWKMCGALAHWKNVWCIGSLENVRCIGSLENVWYIGSLENVLCIGSLENVWCITQALHGTGHAPVQVWALEKMTRSGHCMEEESKEVKEKDRASQKAAVCFKEKTSPTHKPAWISPQGPSTQTRHS
eukprot:1145773-Pelagomonas_calceolata.AAC.2